MKFGVNAVFVENTTIGVLLIIVVKTLINLSVFLFLRESVIYLLSIKLNLLI